MTHLLAPADREIDRRRLGFGRQLGGQEDRRPQRGKRHVRPAACRPRCGRRLRCDSDRSVCGTATVLARLSSAPSGTSRHRARHPATAIRQSRSRATLVAQRFREHARIGFERGTRQAGPRSGIAASDSNSTPVREIGRSRAGSVSRARALSIHGRPAAGRSSAPTNVGASSPARPFSSASNTALVLGHARPTGLPATDALQIVAPAGSVIFRKLRWLLRTA